MKHLPLFSLLLAITLFSGCSSKQYFEPENTYSASHASQGYGANVIDLSRNGGTLNTGSYLGKAGISQIKLGEGYRFINENTRYILASNSIGTLKIINKSTQKTLRTVALHTPIVSASINNGVIAYILNNNTFGIYLMAKDQKVIESRSERTYAIDTRAASPMFVENLVVMPMLDGKIIIVNIHDSQNAKVVYISNESSFNNVIYLSRVKNTMIASTPTRVITLGGTGKKEYKANISEIAVEKNRIYLFTQEGHIIALNLALEVMHQTQFKFAHYAVGTAIDGKVYALDQQGSLIVLNSTLSQSKIYHLGSINEPVFITGNILYKDGKRIELSALGYE
ncbi:MAG: hypothetical protein Q9M36_11570 [Sulfurovum sp.]|nr:hypothetical protein [Sulfurovum sp.]